MYFTTSVCRKSFPGSKPAPGLGSDRNKPVKTGAAVSDEGASQTARRMWTLTEPVHAVTYFAAEARASFEAAGLRGFWRGYFAGRSAPLGAVTAAPVTASFFTFAPSMVSRALPGVWDLITPAGALQAREEGAVAALSRLLAGLDEAVAVAADMLAAVMGGLDCPGRVLAEQAAGRLAGRGLLAGGGAATPAGAALLADAERATDEAASRPWLDREFAADLAAVLYPIAVACAAELPALNPIGVPAPDGGA